MVRTSSFSLLLMYIVGTTGVASAEDYEPAPVKLAYDKEVRGVLFDATGKQNYFPTPRTPREFSDWGSFFSFMRKELFAVPVYEENGKLGGVTLAASLVGEAYRLTEYGEVVRVGCDPVGEYLVGEFGYFVVGGE